MVPGFRQVFVSTALPSLAFALSTAACSPSEKGSADASSSADAASADDESTGSTTGGAADCGGVPTTEAALTQWLNGGDYLAWTADSSPHDSAGPHFGAVRVYVNGCLAESLAAGSEAHPEGSVAVKELYGNDTTLGGWSVMVKLDGQPQGSWYWYELYNGTLFGEGVDASLCTGCHDDGVDSMWTTWPLD